MAHIELIRETTGLGGKDLKQKFSTTNFWKPEVKDVTHWGQAKKNIV